MKKTTLGIVALLAIATLAGCNSNKTPVENPEQNAEIANPASVYCEEKGGTLNLEEGLCMFEDGSYCEEWSYYNNECQPGEIIYNTVSDEENNETAELNFEIDLGTSELYSEEDLKSAVSAIMNIFTNEWDIKCDMQKVSYMGDDTATSNLDYCKNFYSDVEECAVFSSNFHIPNTDQQLAGGFEPDSDIEGWTWYLGRPADGDRIVLTNGLG